MAVPIVAVVGRPNVGKSSLFNWLAAKRIAIVDPTAGVTRDRVSALVKADDFFFELTDTGGMGIQDVDGLTADVERQITFAIEKATLLLFLVDIRTGRTPLDEEVANRLRAAGKPVLLIANKCDTPGLEAQAADFYSLGYGQPLCASAQQNRGKTALMRWIHDRLPPADGPAPATEVDLKLAIVGRRNTGKSTFINHLAREERMIVSEVAGTTRDSVDIRFERDGRAFIAIDTAGVRRKSSVHDDVEFYSMARAERSIRRADVVLHFLDPKEPISRVDKKLAEYVLEQYKPVVFVVNKWDLMKPMPTGQYADYIYKIFPMLDFVPLAFITAKEGRNVNPLVSLAQTLHKQASARVSTPDLNRVLRQALEDTAPPLRQNRRPKIFFGTQVTTNPPTVVLFTNGTELFDLTYQRYLLKTFRDQLPFNDVPIKLYLRDKTREDVSEIPEGETVPPHRPVSDRKPTKTKVLKLKAAKKQASIKATEAKKGQAAEAAAPELWDDV